MADPLGFLVGSYRGEGVAQFPTMPAQVRYAQALDIVRVGPQLLEHRSISWNPLNDQPMAAECGWWRLSGETELQLLISHSFGLLELFLGRLDSQATAVVVSDVAVRAPGAREVTAGRRRYGRVGDDLAYVVEMAAAQQPLQPHLSARLRRVSDGEPERRAANSG